MKHHSNCRYLRTEAEAEYTILGLGNFGRVKQCNHCGAFERSTSPIVEIDFSHLERRLGSASEDDAIDDLFDRSGWPPNATPTGRTSKPLSPEPHRLPRRGGLAMALVKLESGEPHWVDTFKLGRLNFLFLYSVMEQTSEGAVYTPVRFITFDQGSGHANP